MKASEIKVAFREYLKTPSTNYAIFINGKWGIWKNVFLESVS